MRLNDALAGVVRLGFDTPPFIYLVERHPRYLDLVREVVRRVDSGSFAGYTSVVTLAEVLTGPLRVDNRVIEDALP